ncbi:unnamed protein product, partial [Hapterophycus canaliculatus]
QKVVGEEAVNLATEGKGGGLNINIRDKRRDYLKEVVEETLKSWNSKKFSTGNTAAPASSTVSSPADIPPATASSAASAGSAAGSAAATAAAATAAAAAAAASTAAAATAAAAAAETNRGCPVTPPRVRTDDRGTPVAAAADTKPHELTRLEYRIGKCTWRLTMGSKVDQEDAVGRHSEQMEVGLTGLSSTHNYLAEGGPGSGVVIENVMFQIERLWVRSLAPTTAVRGGGRRGAKSGKNSKGKAAENSASRPNGSQSKPSSPASSSSVGVPSPPSSPPGSAAGSSNTAAPVATGDGSGRMGRAGYDSRSMLSPTLLYDVENPCTTSACTSCKQNFVPEENAWNSCRFHCDGDGEDGVFVIDVLGRPAGLLRPAAGRTGRWSCCGSGDSSAAGCTPRPHKPKEIMVSVRAEGGPSVLVGNTEVSVFKHLEVNIFPSIPYNLSINIRREEAAALQQYFKLEVD